VAPNTPSQPFTVAQITMAATRIRVKKKCFSISHFGPNFVNSPFGLIVCHVNRNHSQLSNQPATAITFEKAELEERGLRDL
jgi:hypothetical protein